VWRTARAARSASPPSEDPPEPCDQDHRGKHAQSDEGQVKRRASKPSPALILEPIQLRLGEGETFGLGCGLRVGWRRVRRCRCRCRCRARFRRRGGGWLGLRFRLGREGHGSSTTVGAASFAARQNRRGRMEFIVPSENGAPALCAGRASGACWGQGEATLHFALRCSYGLGYNAAAARGGWSAVRARWCMVDVRKGRDVRTHPRSERSLHRENA
jgi:hypothetical protein